jgi:hypothetical protein
MPSMWKAVHLAAILCAVYTVQPVVSQGLWGNFIGILQGSATPDERNGHGILGMSLLSELCHQSEQPVQGHGQENWRSEQKNRGSYIASGGTHDGNLRGQR